MSESVIEDATALQDTYVPAEVINRDNEHDFLNSVFSNIRNVGAQNLVIDGSRGTGKTHLLRRRLHELPETVNTCYVSCRRNNSQYKILSEVYRVLFDDPIEEGHHTATLQQELTDRLRRQTVIVLDDLEFLLFTNGDDLLYYLSRELPQDVTIILIVSNGVDLESRLEERTYSSLHPQQLTFDPYTEDELFDILAHRAQKSLTPESLQRQALQHIATTVSNPRVGLHWLRTAGEVTGDAITESVVRQVQSQVYQRYVDAQLEEFTIHHRLTYQAVKDLTIAPQTSTRTGQIYDRYRRLCDVFFEEPLSRRRISDFLKHLELLDLIQADYHYGGKHGRTREIRLSTPSRG